jgi:hypothetical protein
VTAKRESRDKFLRPIDEHWEVLRYVEHAQFFAFCVTICSIYDKGRGTLRLTELCRYFDCTDDVKPLLPIVDKVQHLRHNIFAHRNISTSWERTFAEAAIKPDDLERLAEGTLSLLNDMLEKQNLTPVIRSSLPREEFERLMRAADRD